MEPRRLDGVKHTYIPFLHQFGCPCKIAILKNRICEVQNRYFKAGMLYF